MIRAFFLQLFGICSLVSLTPLALGTLLLWLSGARLSPWQWFYLGAAGAGAVLLSAVMAWRWSRQIEQRHAQLSTLLQQLWPPGAAQLTPPLPQPEIVFDEMSVRLRELAALQATVLDLANHTELSQLLHAIGVRSSELLGVEASFIFENAAAQRTLRLLATTLTLKNDPPPPVPYGAGAIGQVAATGERVVVYGPVQLGDKTSLAMTSAYQALLAVPIRWQGQLLGVLGLATTAGQRRFAQWEIALAEQFAVQVAAIIQSARVYQTLERETQRLGTLQQASESIGRTLDFAQICKATYHAVGQLMPNDVFAVVLVNEGAPAGELVYLMRQGQTRPLSQGAWEQPLVAYMLRTGHPLLLQAANEWPAAVSPERSPEGVQAVLVVPMQVGEQQLGGLITATSQVHAYTPADMALLVTLATHTAAAIQNARLFQATHNQLTQLAILYEVAQAAFSTADLNEIIFRALTTLHRQVAYPWLGVMLLDESSQMLKLHQASEQLFPRQKQRFLEPVGQGLAGQVAATGQAIRVGVATQASRLLPDTRSQLCVPLKVGERVIGVINALSPEPEAFTEQDERLLTIVAGLLAPIIENSHLVEQDRALLNELALLNEITRVMVAAPDFDSGLTQVVQVLQKHFGCEVLGINFVDEGGQWLVAHPSYWGVTEERALQALPTSEGLLGVAFRTHQLARSQEVAYASTARTSQASIRVELAVPLLAGEHLIGILHAGSVKATAFDASEAQLLTVVANLLAPLIESHRLRTRAEQQAQDLDFLVRAQAAVSASLEPSQVLAVVVEQLGLAVQVTSAFVVELDETHAITKAAYYSPAALPQEHITDLHLPFPLSLMGNDLDALRQGQMLHIYTDDLRLSTMVRANLQRYGVRAVLKVPLVRQNRTLGYVELRDSRADRVFTEAASRLAQALAGNAASALENARLYTTARRIAEQMRLVNEVGRDIAGILDIDSLLAQVSRRLESTFGYYHVKVGLIEGDTVIFRSRFDERRQVQMPDFRLRLDGPGIIAWVGKNARSRLTNNILNDPHFLPHLLLLETKAEAATPLLAHGQVIGVLDVQSNQLGELDEATLTVLEAISAQLAVAVENARLFMEVERHAAEVSALLTTTLTVSSSMELSARLQAIAHHARRMVEADACTIYKLSADGRQLVPLMALDEHYAQQTLADVLTVGEGLIGDVAQRGVGEMVNRADLDTRARQIPGTPLTPESLMAVPLAVGQRVTGVMAVYREGLREFRPHDFELLTSFAAQAAVALEHSGLYQTLVERANSLQIAYNELSEMDRLKDEMVQNISHELRTPLTFLKSYLEMLINGDFGPLQPTQLQSLHIIFDKSQALERLVNDITTLQAVSATTLQRQRLDISELALTAAAGVKARAQELGVELVPQIEERSVWVLGDAWRLTQVLDNLLSNALKFTERGGRVWLRVRVTEANEARVEVQDTGIGIAQEYQERIFERFYQVDGSTSRKRGGLGLGLAICKIIIEAHGGQIGVTSETGQGSIFFFLLPLAGEESSATNVAIG